MTLFSVYLFQDKTDLKSLAVGFLANNPLHTNNRHAISVKIFFIILVFFNVFCINSGCKGTFFFELYKIFCDFSVILYKMQP